MSKPYRIKIENPKSDGNQYTTYKNAVKHILAGRAIITDEHHLRFMRRKWIREHRTADVKKRSERYRLERKERFETMESGGDPKASSSSPLIPYKWGTLRGLLIRDNFISTGFHVKHPKIFDVIDKVMGENLPISYDVPRIDEEEEEKFKNKFVMKKCIVLDMSKMKTWRYVNGVLREETY